MGLFSSILDLFSDDHSSINPASGLPMVNSCIDVGGNVFDTAGIGGSFSSDHSFGDSVFD